MVICYLEHQVDEKKGQTAAVSGMTEWLFVVRHNSLMHCLRHGLNSEVRQFAKLS